MNQRRNLLRASCRAVDGHTQLHHEQQRSSRHRDTSGGATTLHAATCTPRAPPPGATSQQRRRTAVLPPMSSTKGRPSVLRCFGGLPSNYPTGSLYTSSTGSPLLEYLVLVLCSYPLSLLRRVQCTRVEARGWAPRARPPRRRVHDIIISSRSWPPASRHRNSLRTPHYLIDPSVTNGQWRETTQVANNSPGARPESRTRGARGRSARSELAMAHSPAFTSTGGGAVCPRTAVELRWWPMVLRLGLASIETRVAATPAQALTIMAAAGHNAASDSFHQ